jgi:hypothetical protein
MMRLHWRQRRSALRWARQDVTMETADVVLISDNLRNIPFAISIGRHARTVIWQNLSIAVSVIVTLVTSALGFPCRCRLALLVMKAPRCSFVSMVCGSWHSAQMEFLTGLTLGYENSFVRIASDHPLGLASE